MLETCVLRCPSHGWFLAWFIQLIGFTTSMCWYPIPPFHPAFSYLRNFQRSSHPWRNLAQQSMPLTAAVLLPLTRPSVERRNCDARTFCRPKCRAEPWLSDEDEVWKWIKIGVANLAICSSMIFTTITMAMDNCLNMGGQSSFEDG